VGLGTKIHCGGEGHQQFNSQSVWLLRRTNSEEGERNIYFTICFVQLRYTRMSSYFERKKKTRLQLLDKKELRKKKHLASEEITKLEVITWWEISMSIQAI
jgi:hypothetical protein